MFERQLHYNVKILMYFTAMAVLFLGSLILSYFIH